MKLLKRATLLALVAFVLAALAASAAAPSVIQGRADVDGTPTNSVGGNWNTTANTGNSDFFIFGCPGNDGGTTTGCVDGSKTATSAWFMRYDPNTQTLYVFVLALGGNKIHTTEDSYIKMDGSGNKIIDKTFANFAWYNLSGTNADGWEAKATGITCGTSHTIRIETHAPSGATSGSGPTAFSISLPCTATAVTVSRISAENTDSGMIFALLTLGGAGLVVLGGLVFFAARKR